MKIKPVDSVYFGAQLPQKQKDNNMSMFKELEDNEYYQEVIESAKKRSRSSGGRIQALGGHWRRRNG